MLTDPARPGSAGSGAAPPQCLAGVDAYAAPVAAAATAVAAVAEAHQAGQAQYLGQGRIWAAGTIVPVEGELSGWKQPAAALRPRAQRLCCRIPPELSRVAKLP